MASPAETAAIARTLRRDQVDGAMALIRRLAENPSSPLGIAMHEGESGGDGKYHILGIVAGRVSHVEVYPQGSKPIRGLALIVQRADGGIDVMPNDGGHHDTHEFVTVDQARELFEQDRPDIYEKIIRALSTHRTHRKKALRAGNIHQTK